MNTAVKSIKSHIGSNFDFSARTMIQKWCSLDRSRSRSQTSCAPCTVLSREEKVVSWLGETSYIGMPHKLFQILLHRHHKLFQILLHRHHNVHNLATDRKKSPKAKSVWFAPDFSFRDGAALNERVVVAPHCGYGTVETS